MFAPHTGAASIWLGGSLVTLKFDWEGLSRLQGRFGEDWLAAIVDAVDRMDVKKMSLVAECVTTSPIRITPSFAAGLDDAALVLASNIRAALGAAFSGPGIADEPKAADSADSSEPESKRPASEAKWIEDSYAAAIVAGICPEVFWRLTPYQTRIAIRGASERITAEQRQLISAAWFGEVFARQKRLPSLEQVFKGGGREIEIPDDATPDQAVAIMRAGLGDANGGRS